VSKGGVTALTNGNYVVISQWNLDEGAATWGPGTSGITGAVSASNSLVGSSVGDGQSEGVTALTNGNYVVFNPYFTLTATHVGAVTWGNGTTGITGTISASNSLVGSTGFNEVGRGGVTALTNGNYVVCSPYFSLINNDAYLGAATWGNGTTGTTGIVSASNSIVGSSVNDHVGSGGATALANGNYVVKSPLWNNEQGAATWGSGSTVATGTVSASNSLIGSSGGTSGDQVSSAGVVVLPNGNYVVLSPLWNNSKGAVTWGSGTMGVSGTLSSTNSLVGTTGGGTGDKVGSGGGTILADGNFVVSSPKWNNAAGAVTWMDGTTGTTLDGQNTFDGGNSLLGASASAGLGPVRLGAINGSFVAAFPTEGNGRVTVGFVPSGAAGSGQLTYGFAPTQTITEPPDVIAETLAAGTNVVLQANDDITINSPITVIPTGTPGSLTLQAGRSILLNDGITNAGGNLTLIANDTKADGVVDSQRDPGNAVITMISGVILNTGTGALSVDLKTSTDKTNNGKGVVTLLGLTATLTTLSSSSTLGITIDGQTPGDGVTVGTYTQTNVTGPINLNLAPLQITHAVATSVGEMFTIVHSTGGISGTFAGLPEGAAVAASDGTPYTISYQGNGGNAVVLTQDAPATSLHFSGTAVGTYRGTTSLTATLTFGATTLANESVTFTMNGTSVGSATTDANGVATLSASLGTLSAGTYLSYVSASFAGDSSHGPSSSTTDLTVNPAPLTVTGITAANKIYDTTTTASLNVGGAALVGVFAGDTVTLNTGAASGVFVSANVGSGITVTVTGLTLGGAQAGNYVVTATTTANISAAPLTVTGITGVNKVYDATTKASLNVSAAALVGVYPGDTVTLNTSAASGVFVSANVGIGITVTVTGLSLGGAQAGDYVVTATTTASISAATLTVTGITGVNKVYDATTKASLNVSGAALVGVYPGDTVTLNTSAASGVFVSANIGSGITVTVIGLTLGGAQAGDYMLAATTTTTAKITAAPLTITANTNSKTYDGTTSAAAIPTVMGLLGTDTATGLAETYADPNVGMGKTLSVSAYTVNDGNSGQNYTVTLAPNMTGAINRAPLTITANNQSMVHGSSLPALTASYSGFVNGETPANLTTLPTLSTTATPASPPGTYPITASGAADPNYVITYVPGSLTVTPAISSILGRYGAAGQWWMGASTGSAFTNSLWASWNPNVTWVDVQTGDFNGDGHSDIIGRDLQSGNWWVGISNGSNGFSTSLWASWSPNVTWVDVHVGDFNGDGKDDIVGRVLQTGQWWVGISNGSTGFNTTLWDTWSPNVTWVDVKVADFSGDHKADITGRWMQGGQWWTAVSTGTSFNTSLWAQWNPNVTWVDVQAGDFSGDGKADITGRWLQAGQWYTGVSTGSSFNTTLWDTWSPNVTWVDVKVGDFTGNGRMDLVGRVSQTGQWWVALSTGSSFTNELWATWNPNVIWVDVQVGDFSGDGKADIAGRWLQAGQWYTGVSNGSTAFTTTLWDTWSPAANWVDVQSGRYM
jgi:hypothetical protein